MTFNVEVLCKMLSSKYELSKTCLSVTHTLLRGINGFLHICSIFSHQFRCNLIFLGPQYNVGHL